MEPPSSDRWTVVDAQRRRARVLLVDDDPIILRATAAALGHHDVVVTTSAVEAVDRIARGERFDAVFCDAVMPDLSGLDVFAAMTAVAPELSGRFILVTSGLFDRLASAAAALGIQVLEKPFDLAELEVCVDRLRRR